MNFEVKELKFTPGVEKVPDDASMVVVVRPTSFPEAGVRALKNYMDPPGSTAADKKGKLVVLFGPPAKSGGAGLSGDTGLEAFLSQFDVRVNKDRVLTTDAYRTRLGVMAVPTLIRVGTNPQSSNPVAQAFSQNEGGQPVWQSLFDDVRTIDPVTTPNDPHMPAPKGRYHAETFLLTLGRTVWSEKNLNADPDALVDDLRKPGNATALAEKASKTPLPLAVTVTEEQQGGKGEGQPRLAVFGSATWLDDPLVGENAGNGHLALFQSTLNWLRGSGPIGELPPPKNAGKPFVLTDSPDLFWRMLWQPGVVLVFCIVAVGGAVWLVRRR
jgi:hypothetical protein